MTASATLQPVPVILAAGMGIRLGAESPKCLVEVAGEPVLARTLRALGAAGLPDPVIVTGFRATDVKRFVATKTSVAHARIVENQEFASTGTARSLALGLAAVPDGQPVLIIEADVVFEPALLSDLLSARAADAVALHREQPEHSGSVVTLDAGGCVERWYHERTRPASLPRGVPWKTVNLNRFAATTWTEGLLPALAAAESSRGPSAPAELAYAAMVDAGRARIAGVDVGAHAWFEVDTPADLEAAERLFTGRLFTGRGV